MRKALTLALVFQLTLAPAALAAGPEAQPSPSPSATPSPTPTPEAKSRAGWRSHQQLGLWWNTFDAKTQDGEISQPGLLSLTLGAGREYNFDPVYLGYSAEFHAPQIFFKAIGLGVFYFFCFFLTAGRCHAKPSFATGDRDAGYLGLGPHVGYEFSPIPLKLYAGFDLGLYYTGAAPAPFTAVFSKAGVAFGLGESFGLDLGVRRSISMAEWDLEDEDPATEADVWLMTLNVVHHF
jgi:hypothetical protein